MLRGRLRHSLGAFLLFGSVEATAAEAAPAEASDGDAKGAKSAQGVAVVPLRVEGVLAERWEELLTSRLVKGVRRLGRPVVGPQDVAPAAADGASCRTQACRAEVTNAAGSRYLIEAAVSVDGRDFEVELGLFDGRTGALLATSGENCEVCAVQEVGDVLASHAAIIGAKLDALDRAVPMIRFESTPPGAVVYLDGKPLGEAPLDQVVDPGPHRARAELRGHVALEQGLEAVPGSDDRVHFELQRTPRNQRIRPWGWAMLGVGVPSTVAGVTLLVLDEKPYRVRCTGEYVDEFGNCRLRYNTLPAGVALTSIGVVALIAAGAILGLSRARPGQRPSERPGQPRIGASVRYNRRSSGIALHGRF